MMHTLRVLMEGFCSPALASARLLASGGILMLHSHGTAASPQAHWSIYTCAQEPVRTALPTPQAWKVLMVEGAAAGSLHTQPCCITPVGVASWKQCVTGQKLHWVGIFMAVCPLAPAVPPNPLHLPAQAAAVPCPAHMQAASRTHTAEKAAACYLSAAAAPIATTGSCSSPLHYGWQTPGAAGGD
jgi:hypothetical protein